MTKLQNIEFFNDPHGRIMVADEQEVMRLFCEGYDEAAIANELSMSPGTVKTTKRNAFRKVGVHSLAEFQRMRYKEIVKGNFSKMRNDESLMWASIDLVDEMLEDIKEHHPDMYWAFLRNTHELMCGKHYNEAYAKWQVDNMWHISEDGREHKGERWSMKDAANAMTKYRGRFPNDYNEYDFYVAINAQWHDTICVAKRHFSTEEEAEAYILDEAVAVWLNDSDWPANDKVWSYFRCKS